MTAIGADPDALRELGRRFDRLQRQIDSSRAALDRQLRESRWEGRDAERFRHEWSVNHRNQLLRSAELCRISARRLRAQADQQLRASEAGTRGPTHPDNAAGHSRSGGTGTEVGAHTCRRGGDGAEGSMPASIMELRAGANVTIASVLLGLANDVQIEELGDGTSRVTFTDAVNGGAKVSLGAKVNLDSSLSLGVNGSIDASAGAVRRRTFVVDSKEVWRTVAAVELADASHKAAYLASTGPLGALGGAFPAAKQIAGWLGDLVPRGVKDAARNLIPRAALQPPTHVEKLGEVSVAGQLGVTSIPIIGPSAAGDGSYLLRAGRGNGPAGAASIFEVEGAVAAELKSRLFGDAKVTKGGRNSNTMVPTLRVEILDPPGNGKPRGAMVITTTTTEGDLVRRTVNRVDTSKLVDVDVMTKMRSAISRVAAGDPVGAVQQLAAARIPPEAIRATSATFAASGYSGALGAEVGEGISAGLDLDGGVQRLVRKSWMV